VFGFRICMRLVIDSVIGESRPLGAIAKGRLSKEG
jgi:hypothetical protein